MCPKNKTCTSSAKNSKLLSVSENDNLPEFYFLHSFYFNAKNKYNVSATANYGLNFDAMVSCNNIHGVQFHPEKSHNWGEKLLVNFSNL